MGFEKMITSLSLQEYRAFKTFRIDDLSRVNLLVGKNGSGKTSVLEAIEILSKQGDIATLNGITRRRGETPGYSVNEEFANEGTIQYPNVKYFFRGGKISRGAHFEIAGNQDSESVYAEIIDVSPEDEQVTFDSDMPERVPEWVFKISGERFLVYEDGAVSMADRNFSASLLRLGSKAKRGKQVQFISTDSRRSEYLSANWNSILIDSKENEVINAMRILDPSIENIFFLSDSSRRAEETVLVSFTDKRGRVPLGSTGEGMRRLLALSLALVEAKNGILLVDEIDTGLHYSVLGDMWHLIAKAAKNAGTQVFATTHSLDCVKGLAWLCENHPELADEVALHKIDNSLEKSVALNGEQLVIASEQDIEVR